MKDRHLASLGAIVVDRIVHPREVLIYRDSVIFETRWKLEVDIGRTSLYRAEEYMRVFKIYTDIFCKDDK